MAALSPIEIGKLASQAGLPLSAVPVAVAVALAESGGNPNSDNGLAAGLWQINYKAHPQYSAASLKDPVTNARAMASISKNGTDWSAWSTHPSSAGRGLASATGIQNYNRYLLQTNGIDWGKVIPGGLGGTGLGLLPVGGQNIDPLQPFTAIPSAIIATQKWLADRNNIMRLVYWGAGSVLIFVSAYMIAGGAVLDGLKKVIGSDAAKAATKVLPQTKAIKAVKATSKVSAG